MASGTSVPVSSAHATDLSQEFNAATTIQFGNGVLDNPQNQSTIPTVSATAAQGNAASETGSTIPQFTAAGSPAANAPQTGSNPFATHNMIILDVALVSLGILAIVLIARSHATRS